VIDTTGSMGDEIDYLKNEFIGISRAIFDNYPNAAQRWSVVAYRDTGDSYVVRTHDFESDPNTIHNELAALSADGGGDFPEAPDQALTASAQLGWRADSTTARLVFWVADAPHHDDKAAAMAAAIQSLRDRQVHIYPVASSGVDEFTELSMRAAAQISGGRYLFLTDDSGVGYDHLEPSLPCYFVTKLNAMIARVVDIELSGMYRQPDATDIIRTEGNPIDGTCQLASGATAFAY
jgi:hypothetical protein